MLSVGLVCTFYSTLGGMKAVLMADVFQALLMFGSVFSVIFMGKTNLTSVVSAHAYASCHQKFRAFDGKYVPTVPATDR